MRVGWLPGRRTEAAVPGSLPGLEFVSLDEGRVDEPPDLVVVDQVEPEVLTAWMQQPIALVIRTVEPPTVPADSEALIFHLPPNSSAEELLHTLHHADAALHRLRELLSRVAELQRRLTDRIVVEKAKGLLTQRFGLTEDEAYRRMRLQSRQERRPMREIAEAVLTSLAVLPLEPVPQPG